ncbi:MAG TPA: 30S ribosomal protein S20 [candidate division Zixibacteria bacterium]|nr:30S ribosomal protein S20 [candidate division Zixibacteria bacterium]
MPYKKHRTVWKRMRQNIKRRERNRIIRGSVRAVLRAIRTQKSLQDVLDRLAWKLPAENQEELLKLAQARMYSIIDKALKKGVIHRNKAARHKSQIAQWANRVAAGQN